MDIAFHGLAGLALSKALTGEYLPSAALFSMLPDLGAVPHFYHSVKNSSKISLKHFTGDYMGINYRGKFLSDFDRNIYWSTHSLFSLIPVSLIAFFIFGNIWWILSLSYLSHLIIDAFTHEHEASFHPLWPLSDWSISGKSYSSNKNVLFLSWFTLLVILLLQ